MHKERRRSIISPAKTTLIRSMAGTLNGLPRLWWLNSGMMGLPALSLFYAVARTLPGPKRTATNVPHPPALGNPIKDAVLLGTVAVRKAEE